MRRIVLSYLVLLVGWVTVLQASPYDDARWRAQLIVDADTLRFWLDPGIYDETKPGFMKWEDSQSAARSGCMNCNPNGWGVAEFMQYRMNQMMKEQNPRYLADLTFFFMNVERVGAGSSSLAFRLTAADSVIVSLSNGRRFVAEPPKHLDVAAAVARRGEGFEMTCRQVELQLGGQALLTRSQIDGRRRQLAYRHARYNEFILPITIKNPPRNLFDQVQAVRIYFNGKPISFERNGQDLVGAR